MVAQGWASEQLIKAAQAGDLESIAAVVHGAHPHVRRFARQLCASSQDAEDAAQEALIVLYRKIGSLRASAALASWMFRIVRNECLRRAQRLFDHYDDVDAAPVASAEDEVLGRLEAERVAAAIRALPDLQRRVLIMRDVLGHPGRTVAEALGVSTAAMKSNLHRARTTLRLSLRGGLTPSEVDPDPTTAGA
ncbi:RNA polymerase sigma factor, sigma-70 family [Actinokineospora alba]|uniref:RNA polymerase sigma factor, sigma-70 family n=1 Tax=Actinokineospora alba TaxID=504798 RepID=A0A1H0LUU2_9PSEU|nr:RNA polymerase sigma factor (sigma-70 family) [Actinokineospora alba]SDI95703.1 RNA polymerase sigma factor, sigma-70 family [Actinokineospora alba]SDO71905.1 RNA polymerase sigma factor, sigma-70 family [Actinokineospora alba]